MPDSTVAIRIGHLIKQAIGLALEGDEAEQPDRIGYQTLFVVPPGIPVGRLLS